MPRGRKRNADNAVNERNDNAHLDRPEGEEEIFVDIVESDEMVLPVPPNLVVALDSESDSPAKAPSAGGTIVDAAATATGSIDQTAASDIGNVAQSSSSLKPHTKRRKLPIPRLVNPENDVKPPKKLTPRGGARTRAMTVHESVVNDAQLKIVKTEDLDEGEITQIESHTCDQCGIILYSSIELLEHQRGFHKETIKVDGIPSGTLLCAFPQCTASFPNVSYLISHLVAYHSQQQFRIRKKTFDTIDKFWDWKNEIERVHRCEFMGNAGPEETSTDTFEFTSYCNYCDDWREQDRNGMPIPEQVPKKIFGCPAYFTATFDNKRKRASIIGCFSHLGHHKKDSCPPKESKILVKDSEIRRTDTISVANIKCELCDMMFRSRSAATRHHRMVHRVDIDADGNKKAVVVEPKMPSLECADPECDVLCDSMVTLVQHVAEAHKADVEVNEFKFPNLSAFESWKCNMEQSTCSRFCKVSGRVLPNEITKYFLCHLSGHTNRTKKKEFTPQEKQRNRPTKKMGRYCTAFMSFKQNKIDGSVSVRGCLRHFGHQLDVRRLPLPEQVRKEISELLLKGLAEEEVVQQIRAHYNESERGHWTQRYEVRNIALKLQREGLLLASRTYITAEEDGRVWDEMGFPEDGGYVQTFVPVRSSTKLVQYKPVHHARNISIHEAHNDRPTHSRYLNRPKIEPMEVVQYVDAGEYEDEEEQLEDGDVYYEQEIEEEVLQGDGTRMIPLQPHVVVTQEMPPLPHGGRKRMPLLKEPMRTGNPAFDDVMAKMKNRFNRISQQLKVTQDVRLAHGMLKELKDLQHRMGVGHNDVLVEPHWNDEYYEDVDPEEYHIEQAVEHEGETSEHGYFIEDGIVGEVEGDEQVA